jgi:tetratricopeptide (TPR) repeat protein
MKSLFIILIFFSINSFCQDSSGYYYNLGLENFKKGKYDVAIHYFDKVIAIHPSDSAYFTRGTIKHRIWNQSEAVSDFKEAIKLNPKNVAALVMLGWSLSAFGKAEDAIIAYNKAIVLSPKNAEAYSGRGNANIILKRYSDAKKDYTKAMKLNPKDKGAYGQRASAEFGLRQYRLALKDYDLAINLQPDYSTNYVGRGRCKIAAGDKINGCKDLEKAVEMGNKKAKEFISKLCN